MHIYDYAPKKNTMQLTGVILCLASLAAGLFLPSVLIQNLPFKWAFQLVSIAILTVVIFIVTRFMAKSFLYSVVQTDNDALDFTVTEITNGGRSKITVCRIALRGIESVEEINRGKKSDCEAQRKIEKKAKKEGRKSFNYCPSLSPASVCILLCEECGEKFLIKLECDDTLLSYFKNS